MSAPTVATEGNPDMTRQADQVVNDPRGTSSRPLRCNQRFRPAWWRLCSYLSMFGVLDRADDRSHRPQTVVAVDIPRVERGD
jgi:hypothetical protein